MMKSIEVGTTVNTNTQSELLWPWGVFEFW